MPRTARQPVKAFRRGGCLQLRLARGERCNALDRASLLGLLGHLARPPSPAPVLVLSGADRLFSVGLDIVELAALDAAGAAQLSRLGHAVIAALEAWPAPTIALLEGYCLGSGLELALACDLLVGTADLKLGMPGLAWGMLPCMGGLRRLARRYSSELASRLFLAGETIDGGEAVALGILDRLSGEDAELRQLIAALGEFPPGAVSAIRALRLERLGRDDPDAEAACFAQPFATGECQRRLKALIAG